ncbi:MAG: hypothetical protein ACI9FB_004410 [Candidatus Azotimanducaceae bacterium]|jgi:hypothetical protein
MSVEIKKIKQSAKALAKHSQDKSYMQCLDSVCQDQLGLRHFHEAQQWAKHYPEKLASKLHFVNVSRDVQDMYLSACQDVYFEL